MLTCAKCRALKNFEAFARNRAKASGFSSYCKPCMARYARNRRDTPKRKNEIRRHYERNATYYYAKVAERRARKKLAIPKWANREAIRAVYAEARRRNAGGEKVHVDHIIPLTSDIVCGLHVETNLQVVPAAENWSKSNRYWPDMP